MNKPDKFIYPSSQDLIEFNFLVIDIIKTKKADKSEVLSYRKIQDIINSCMQHPGDIYDKATVLMVNTIRKHAFASGNRRTAFIITKHFLVSNKFAFNIEDNPSYARIMIGIRENYYTFDEIKNWIQNGKIRAFDKR